MNFTKTIEKLTPEKVFLFLFLSFGGLLVFITPPFQAPDEPAHFYRAYQLSSFTIIGQKHLNQAGGYIPQNIVIMTNEFIGEVPPPPRYRVSIYTILHYLHRRSDLRKVEFVDFRNTVLLSPIVYLPQCFGILIAKVLHLPPLWLVYFGRFFNMLAFIAIVFFSIRIVPVFKWGMVLLALMPMTISLATSLSADSINIAVCFLIIAYLMHFALVTDKKIVKSDIILLSLLTFILGLCKVTYILLPLLFFVIPIKIFPSRVFYIKSILILFISSISGFLCWSLLMKDIYVPLGEFINPQNQIAYIWNHPLMFFSIFIDSILNFGIVHSFVGYLCWLEKPLPYTIVILYILSIASCAIFEKNVQYSLGIIQKVILAFIWLLFTLGISVTLYLSWNDVGFPYIHGLSGRYFIPFAPLILFLFLNRKLQFENTDRILKIWIPFFLVITLSITVWLVFDGHYILYYH